MWSVNQTIKRKLKENNWYVLTCLFCSDDDCNGGHWADNPDHHNRYVLVWMLSLIKLSISMKSEKFHRVLRVKIYCDRFWKRRPN